ncbi:ABC transporter permease [Actinospica robiniae]|uniref:ABC transporter permease n=1 Tax=Actinospica robiniae TaxID=304901 RepID=UPI0003FC544C|nr:ABC transporter permease [Actinospica robiniae]
MRARYVGRKLGFYLVAAWVAVTVNFFLPRLIPGDPVAVIISRQTQSGTVPPGEADALRKLLGLGTGSLLSQYGQYLDQLVHFNFGLSITEFPTPVADVVRPAIAWTLVLVGLATIISFCLGIGLGALAGWKRGTRVDALVPSTTLFTAMPYFWLALLLVYLFSEKWNVLPAQQGYDPALDIGWNSQFLGSALQHSILPALTLVIASIGGWLLGMRNMTVATLSEDFVVAAEARGLSPVRVMTRYAARNAVLPSISGFAVSIGFVISGQIVMEQVFNYPGLGNLLFLAVNNEDYPLMQAIFLTISFAVLGSNLLVDLLYGLIDPRTREA